MADGRTPGDSRRRGRSAPRGDRRGPVRGVLRGDVQVRTMQDASAVMRDALVESRLTPNAISLTGFSLNVVAAVLVTQRLWIPAGAVFLIGSLMDTLDGRYSRMSGKGTKFGAFLDSTLDRIAEGVVLTAVAAYFASIGDAWGSGICVAAVIGSMMVPYTRARAEALGVKAAVGIAPRPVRVALLTIGLVLADVDIAGASILDISVWTMTALTIFTAVQRILFVKRELGKLEQVAAPGLSE